MYNNSKSLSSIFFIVFVENYFLIAVENFEGSKRFMGKVRHESSREMKKVKPVGKDFLPFGGSRDV